MAQGVAVVAGASGVVGSRLSQVLVNSGKLSLMTVANVAKISSKSLISFDGGPGRTRTSNQAVMSR